MSIDWRKLPFPELPMFIAVYFNQGQIGWYNALVIGALYELPTTSVLRLPLSAERLCEAGCALNGAVWLLIPYSVIAASRSP
jgi:hypothetical protein